MRVLLFTGKGGVGKSTVAAGTAALAAASGHRTLVLSTDPAHSLADALDAEVGPEPTPVGPGLWAQQVDAQLRFEQSWAEVRGYLTSLLDTAGIDAVAAGELTVLPGAEEVLALLEVRRQAGAGRDGAAPDAGHEPWDLVVVDCAPTAETLRLLALPEALGFYVDRVVPAERRLVTALRPVLTRAAGVPMPDDDVLDALTRLRVDLDDVRRLLTGPDASVRIVLTPEQVVLAEARRSWTTLSLFGYTVDGVVANRVFPAGAADDWRAGWVASQAAVLDDAEASFGSLPLWRSTYRPGEPVGLPALKALAAEAYGDDDPVAPALAGPPYAVTPGGPGEPTLLRLALPGAGSADVDLARKADELVVTVGSYRRVLALPADLSGRAVQGAGVEDGELRIRFAPAPDGVPA